MSNTDSSWKIISIQIRNDLYEELEALRKTISESQDFNQNELIEILLLLAMQNVNLFSLPGLRTAMNFRKDLEMTFRIRNDFENDSTT